VIDAFDFVVRRYREGDAEAVGRLDSHEPPYRPEDRAAVAAMRVRARRAERRGDPLWMAQPPPAPAVGSGSDDELVVWVAESRSDRQLIGTVALRRAGASAELSRDEPHAVAWRSRADVAELRGLRIVSAWRRRGVATELNRAAFEWARTNGVRELVLNTTAAQEPALSLYRKLGFREAFRCYVGEYELIWMSKRL